MTARPAATSVRTTSTSIPSRAAMKRISGVMWPARAQASWVRTGVGSSAEAGAASGWAQPSRVGGSPAARSWHSPASAYPVYGPEVS